MKQILISGDRSGSGKTSITLALAALLAKECRVQTFKAGMDYIDPSYLTAASGRPCRNLDSFAMNEDQIRAVYSHGCREADIAIVEGVRGLYEGAEALSDTGSTAAIAKALDLPVVLVVSAQSITRSAAALVKGFQSFDPNLRIAGVILNNVKGGSHTSKATTAIEHYCNIPVIGAIPRTEEMQLAMRHLGLVPYREGSGRGDFDERIGAVTRIIGDYVDLDRFRSLMKEGPVPAHDEMILSGPDSCDIRIGIALDEVFNFYYADLFDILRSCGAECVTFSPVHDRQLPEADGYIFGGGYPELFGAELEGNRSMRESVLDASRRGVPIYAECGGLMYLTDRIVLRKGWQGSDQEQSYAMCGVFSGETRMPARRVVSYVEGVSRADSIFGACKFRGHEFHYSDVSLEPGTTFAYCLSRGIGISERMDGATTGRTLGSYTHLHPVASAGMFRKFSDACRHARVTER
jgi:cobyrinic acid a,c-diamide synthase